MNDESARMMELARRDLRAAQGMAGDTVTFTDEIFGFHAQQAVEKACKAWMCGLGVVYPKTHDLDLLFHLLSESGVRVPTEYEALLDLVDFSVQYRTKPSMNCRLTVAIRCFSRRDSLSTSRLGLPIPADASGELRKGRRLRGADQCPTIPYVFAFEGASKKRLTLCPQEVTGLRTAILASPLKEQAAEGLASSSGHEVSFPTKGNPRLESAAEEDVGRIEISPFGLHWPTLDEDLSFAGILEGRYGHR